MIQYFTMILWLLPLSLCLLFGISAFFLARGTFRKRLYWCFFGVLFGAALLLPFRTYKVTPLSPALAEALSPHAILQTKQISIPCHPNAYNPSLLSFGSGYLLSFRVKSHNFFSFLRKLANVRTSYIGLIALNPQFEPVGDPYLLDLASHTAQDARLFSFGGKTLLFFNDYGDTRRRSSYALYVAELREKEGKLEPVLPAKRLFYEKALPIEKNWIPFTHDEQLYLIYSGQPHLILKADPETGLCQPTASSITPFSWPWGEIRGGTPAQLVDGSLLTFFHSSQEHPADSFFGPKVGRNYAMGAYLFENHPPFAIQKMTLSPLGALDDYAEGNRRKVIFPSGIALDQNEIHVVWGKNDSSIWVTTFGKGALLDICTLPP